jgi:SAM-dependent methyltransferase
MSSSPIPSADLDAPRAGPVPTTSPDEQGSIESYDRRGMGHYRGRPIYAVGQLHRLVMARIEALGLPRDVKCLDLGGGSGAFSLRLHDHGFAVDLVDIDPPDLSQWGIRCHQADLNSGDFARGIPGRSYGLITCLEVIEHLENPFSFFRNCAELLARDGTLIVSSPNLESWMARLMFLATGQLPWFGEKGYRENQHTIPHFSWQLPIVARMAGLELVEIQTTDNKFMLYAGPCHFGAMVVKHALNWLVRPCLAGRKNGDVNVYVFCRQDVR